MTDSAVVGEPFRIGACLSRALSTFFANIVRFNLLGLLIMGPGAVLLGVALGAAMLGLYAGNPDTFSPVRFGFTFVGAFVVILGFQYFLTAVLVHATLQYLDGHKPAFLGSLMQGLRRIVPIVGVAIITTLLVWVGAIFFLVPGIIIGVMLSLTIPVVMVEGLGILPSLSRSRALTKGARWQLFGMFVVAVVGSVVIAVIVKLPFDLLATPSSVMAIIGEVVGFVVQLGTTVFLAVLLAVAYHDLRVAKEGVSTAQLASVFD